MKKHKLQGVKVTVTNPQVIARIKSLNGESSIRQYCIDALGEFLNSARKDIKRGSQSLDVFFQPPQKHLKRLRHLCSKRGDMAEFLRSALDSHQQRHVTLADWLATQPGSTKRGVKRGKFQLPKYVKQ